MKARARARIQEPSATHVDVVTKRLADPSSTLGISNHLTQEGFPSWVFPLGLTRGPGMGRSDGCVERISLASGTA